MEVFKKLFYHQWGNSKQTPSQKKLLFLHGMGGTGALWRPIAAVLEDDYWICAPDQRGHGKSRPTSPTMTFSPQDYASDVIEMMKETQFHPSLLIGHSMGVRTAVACATLKPEWVSGLILIDLGLAGPAGGGLGDNLSRFLKCLPESFSSREDAKRFMTQECPDPSIAQYLMATSVQDPQTKQITFPFEHASLIQTIEAAAKAPPIRESLLILAKKHLPILFLRGEVSRVWSADEFKAEQNRFSAYPNVIFEEFKGASHGLPFEKRKEFCERLKTFYNPQ